MKCALRCIHAPAQCALGCVYYTGVSFDIISLLMTTYQVKSGVKKVQIQTFIDFKRQYVEQISAQSSGPA